MTTEGSERRVGPERRGENFGWASRPIRSGSDRRHPSSESEPHTHTDTEIVEALMEAEGDAGVGEQAEGVRGPFDVREGLNVLRGIVYVHPEASATVRAALNATAHRPPEAMSGWQPIETAPKDGTYVLMYDREADEISVAAFDPAFNRFDTVEGGPVFAPTHWQPLPAAPVTREEPR